MFGARKTAGYGAAAPAGGGRGTVGRRRLAATLLGAVVLAAGLGGAVTAVVWERIDRSTAGTTPADPPLSPAVVPSPPVAPPEPAWRRHAVAAPPVRGRSMIAIVIDDVGPDRVMARRAAALPGPLTMSYLPYTHDLEAQVGHARTQGHEIMLHMPMEPHSRIADPGIHALDIGDDPKTLFRKVDWMLGRLDRYVGVNNHMGSRFTADAPRMKIVLGILKERGLMYLDSRTSVRSVGHAMAREMGMPSVERQVFLDNADRPDTIREQLKRTEATARRNGFAIAIGHPRPATIRALDEWLPTLTRKGHVLVPVTAIAAMLQEGR